LQCAPLLHHSNGSIIGVHHRYRWRALTMQRIFPQQNHPIWESRVLHQPIWWPEPLLPWGCPGNIIMGPARGEPPLLKRTMIGGPIEPPPPHHSQQGRENRPPLPRESRRGGFSHFNHDHTTVEEPSDRSSYNDHSAMVGDAVVGRQPPLKRWHACLEAA
jgi:hypothetical protein